MKKILTSLLLVLFAAAAFSQELCGTYLFSNRSDGDLYLDIYNPAPGSRTTIDGKEKPTVLFVFGGGFISGTRNDPYYLPWFKLMTDAGYRVISTDYRLGLKGVEMKFGIFNLIKSAKSTIAAVDMGIEDVFTAVKYLSDNADELGLDMGNIVLAGSSAGAMISLACESDICNGEPLSAILPEGFRFKGIISYAGALMSDTGTPGYAINPAPHLLFHGDADGAVVYDKTAFGRYGMFGSAYLVDKVFSKKGYIYSFYRYPGHSHDMSANFVATWPEQQRFHQELTTGHLRTVDASVIDPTIPVWENAPTLETIY